MLDIKFIRENKDLVALGVKKKHVNFSVDELIKKDDERRALLIAVENRRAEQNSASTKIASAQTVEERNKLLSEMKVLKESMQKDEESLKKVIGEWQALMLQVPNIPDMSVPDGDSDAQNKEIKTWGTKPNFTFPAKDHVELMTNLKMVDFERGAKVHGFRGYFLTGEGARLSFAIWNYAMVFF